MEENCATIEKDRAENKMGVMPIPKLLISMSLPIIISMLVQALYNIVDSIFVGQGVGDLALAGVTVTLPMITIYMAFIMLIGMGATSLISIRLGEEKADEAESTGDTSVSENMTDDEDAKTADETNDTQKNGEDAK